MEEQTKDKYSHYKLFHSGNVIEKFFYWATGISAFAIIFQGVVSALNVKSTLGYISAAIARNYQVIMHGLHLILIIYVLIKLRNLYEDITKIKTWMDKDNKWLNCWKQWINDNISLKKEHREKLTGGGNKEVRQNINYCIYIANINMKAIHTLWTLIWSGWFILYLGMFVGELWDDSKPTFMFIENLIGNIINFCMLLIFYLYHFYYSGMSRKNLDRELNERKKDNEDFKRKEKKNICNFWCYFVVVALLFIGISIWDGFVTLGTDTPMGRLIFQLIIAALTCISMMLVFGEMNNVCLKLSGMAVAIMFLYAGIQLFAPFGNKEIINETYISSPLFTFFVTTLYFFGKFMVFMIIRWMFTGGRLSYVFIDMAFRYHSSELLNEKQDERNYEAIFHEEDNGIILTKNS